MSADRPADVIRLAIGHDACCDICRDDPLGPWAKDAGRVLVALDAAGFRIVRKAAPDA